MNFSIMKSGGWATKDNLENKFLVYILQPGFYIIWRRKIISAQELLMLNVNVKCETHSQSMYALNANISD